MRLQLLQLFVKRGARILKHNFYARTFVRAWTGIAVPANANIVNDFLSGRRAFQQIEGDNIPAPDCFWSRTMAAGNMCQFPGGR